MNTCSCGETAKHVVMRRKTADDHSVKLWSDGSVTTWDGRPFVPAKRDVSKLWPFMEKVGFYDFAELPELYAKLLTPTPKRAPLPTWLRWTVLSADRTGRPTERVCYVPRIVRANTVIWDFCGGPGSKRGRYSVMQRDGETCFPTGLDFHTLREVVDFLVRP